MAPTGQRRRRGRPVDEFTVDRRVWHFVGRGAAVGLAVGVFGTVLDRIAGLRQSDLLMFAVPIVVGVIVQLVRVGIVDVLPPVAVAEPDSGTPEYFVRLRQLERRLDVATRDPADFEWSIRPVLAQLAADRLNYRHGILCTTQPLRAREIVGDELWEIMRPQANQPDTPLRPASRQRISDLISRIERI